LRFQNITVKEYILKEGDIRFIGRTPEAHIVIDESDVSRRHACIVLFESQLYAWDEGSKHGTLVNGLPVICAKLEHGDVISIGTTHSLKASILTKGRGGTISAEYDRQRNLMTTV
jgi:pSer/pThr/pTyr-binding forkhead associated (FHA) protein